MIFFGLRSQRHLQMLQSELYWANIEAEKRVSSPELSQLWQVPASNTFGHSKG